MMNLAKEDMSSRPTAKIESPFFKIWK